MQVPTIAYALALLGLIVAMLAGFFLFMSNVLRRRTGGAAPSASQMLADFREAHEYGELTDQEFQTIKQRLAPLVQSEGASIAGGATNLADAATALKGTADTLALGLGVANDRADRNSRSACKNQSDGEDQAEGEDPTGGTDHGDRSGEHGSEAGPPDGGDSTGEGR